MAGPIRTSMLSQIRRLFVGSCVFGPVASRRLGRSLGVDLIPHKTCPFDCIYCEVGRTTEKTIERKEWVPLDEVVGQIRARLDSAPDYITLSGSGEPTLYSRLGELIARIKEMTDIPVAVLTNGALLWMPEVRRDLMGADLVVPSLDAPDEGLLRYVNRPHPSITFEKLIEGLVAFRDEFPGQIWLEVLLVAGVTGIDAEVRHLAEFTRRIRPDRVQINTVVRPPAEEFAHPLPSEELERFKAYFGPNTEVIARFQPKGSPAEGKAPCELVFETIARRPCTIADIADGLGISPEEALACIESLAKGNRIESESRDGALFYMARRQEASG